MELSKLVQTGIQNKPPRILLHGVHGVGKSTFAAQSPNPIFLQTEDGLTNIDVPHFPLATSIDEVFHYMGTLIKEDHDYKTFVLDTADWLQTLIFVKVCEEEKVDSIERCGYGKGYIYAFKYWEKFINGLEKLRSKGMAIILLAHSEIKAFNPPDGEAYDRFQIKLHKHAAARLEEWCDMCLFANFKIFSVDGKAVNNNPERIIHTSNRPAWKAKTRFHLPEEMPMKFDELIKKIKTK